MLKVSHITTLGTNPGDDFIRCGCSVLLGTLGVDTRSSHVNKHDPASVIEPRPGDGWAARDKIAEADLVLWTGTPVFWHLADGGATSLNSEWQRWLFEDRIFSPETPAAPLWLLGAGSCFSQSHGSEAFLRDRHCMEFARRLATRAAWISCRDPHTRDIFAEAGATPHLLPCPAFLAALGMPPEQPTRSGILVNLMPLGGHHHHGSTQVDQAWVATCREMLSFLRKLGPVRFLAHREDERVFMQALARDDEPVLLPDSWETLLRLYGSGELLVANRVHAVIAAAGHGVPGVLLANDSRALALGPLDLPVRSSLDSPPTAVLDTIAETWAARATHSPRLLALRDQTLAAYARLLPKPPTPRSPANSSVPSLLLTFGQGFHPEETHEGQPLVWMRPGANVLLIQSTASTGARLSGRVFAPNGTAELLLRGAAGELARASLRGDGFQPMPILSFDLQAGMNRLELVSHGPRAQFPGDTRDLSVAWASPRIAIDDPAQS